MKFKLRDIEEMTNFVKNEEYLIAKLVVDAIVKNISGKRKKIKCLEMYVEDEEEIFEIIALREEFPLALGLNLKTLEKYEDYERCSKVKEALELLKVP